MNVEGWNLADRIQVGDSELKLRGAGARKALFFKPYIVALYSVSPYSDPQEVIDSGEARCVRLIVNSDMVNGTMLVRGFRDGLDRTTFGRSDRLKPQFTTLFEKFPELHIMRGNVVDMAWKPSEGMHIYFEDELIFSSADPDFYKAMFGIWFSSKFPDEKLQRSLLSHQ